MAAERRTAGSSDAGSILETLGDHDVEFLLIGGLAVQAHGYLRSTLDVDILPRPDRADLERLAAALEALDARLLTADGAYVPVGERAEALSIGDIFLSTRFGALDLVNGPRPDLKRYDRLAANSILAELDRFAVRVIGKDDLIAMKRAAGREKDLADINALTEAERQG